MTTAERERTIAFLSDRFAHDELEIEEFEERLTRAHRAETAEELAALTVDLSAPPVSAEPSQAVQLASDAPAHSSAVAIFGGTRRDGAWAVPRHLKVTAVFGGVELDLREARLPAGVIDVEVTTVFGGVAIIVPPTLAVDIQGTAIMGGFEQMDRAPSAPDPNVPLLRIHGLAVFGGVDVQTRMPGESARMSFRRRRRGRRCGRHGRRGWE